MSTGLSVAPNSATTPHADTASVSFVNCLFIGAWFGVIAGFGEGVFLLIFQRINWRAWAWSMHVTAPIIWISPIVDVIVFLLISIGIFLLSRVTRRVPWALTLCFVLSFLTVCNWLLTTMRLYRFASLALAVGVAAAVTRWLARRETAAMKFWRCSVFWLLASVVLVAVVMRSVTWSHERYTAAHLPQPKPGSPNVLLIVIDTLRADHLSSYGYSRQTSPNIDEMARSGVLFENAIAPSSWSLPSHASLVTGRAVHEHGWGNVNPMPWLGWGDTALRGLPTLPETLEQRGYRTGAFSANRIYFTANVGLGRGFMHFEDYFDGVGDALMRTEFGRAFGRHYMHRTEKSAFTRVFRWLGLGSWLDVDSEGSGTHGGTFGIRKRADEVNRETLHWVEKDSSHPFFAMLNYLDVHYAYGGPVDFQKPEWDRGTVLDEYDAGLKYEDRFIGRLLDELRQAGILKNTIVIITADHGESLGDHGLSFHGAALYRELVHVPLIISWPGKIPQGVRIDQPVGNESIASTVVTLSGASSDPFPGPSLSKLWENSASARSWPDPVSELAQTDIIVPQDRVMQGKEPLGTDGSMWSVFTPKWHLITHSKWGDQIYDWRADPGELHNLIGTPEGQAARTGILARDR